MDKILFKKINLLVHLAKVDGKFDSSEKHLLLEILKEKGLDSSYLHSHVNEKVDLNSLSELHGKTELLYWVLKMIKADHQLHPDELAFSKTVALKLNFKPEVVDFYTDRPIPELPQFEHEVKQFMVE